MTATSYDNDPRVDKVDNFFYRVQADGDGDNYDVSARSWPTDWWVVPSLDNRRLHAAGLTNRAEAEGWLRGSERGPFPSAEIALYELLGLPRA